MLGRVITELDQSGQKTRTFVYHDGQVLAWQEMDGQTEKMAWEHRDLSNASVTGAAGAELDPFGSAVGSPFTSNPRPVRSGEALEDARIYPGYSDATSGECQLDGIDTPCSIVQTMRESGALAHETTIRRANGNWDRYQDAIVHHGIGISTTFTYSIDLRTGDSVSDRVFAQLPQNPIRVPLPGTNAIRDRLNSGGCNEYIAQLLAKVSELFGQQGNVAVATDGLGLLEMITKQGGFVLKDYLRVARWPARGTAKGSLLGNNTDQAGTATVIIDTKFVFPDDPPGWVEKWQQDYIDTAIHEMLHLAARYSGFDDRQLAVAASQLPGADPNLPAAPVGSDDAVGYQHNSGYYDAELKKHCGGAKK